MRKLLCLLLLLSPILSFSQQSNNNDFIEEPKYDTTSIDIRSTNTFYFCSKLFTIPRDCDKKDQSACCSFSGQVRLNQKLPVSGQLGCYDGTNLFWMYFENDEQAKSSFEGYSPQIKKQMKKFKQVVIKLSILKQEVPAYQLSYTTAQKHKGYEIIAYGKINGHSLMIHLHSQKDIKLSDELHPVFQQLVNF